MHNFLLFRRKLNVLTLWTQLCGCLNGCKMVHERIDVLRMHTPQSDDVYKMRSGAVYELSLPLREDLWYHSIVYNSVSAFFSLMSCLLEVWPGRRRLVIRPRFAASAVIVLSSVRSPIHRFQAKPLIRDENGKVYDEMWVGMGSS